MKRVACFLLILPVMIIMQSNGIAQNLDTLWTRTYGGADDDYAFSITETYDGGVVITGCTRSDGLLSYFDLCTIKYNRYGDILWSNTYDGPVHDVGNSVQATIDGGLIIAGASYSSYLGSDEALLIKTDAGGDTVWTKRYNGAFFDVLELNDESLIAVGLLYPDGPGNSDIYLVKTDMYGDTLWTNAISGSFSDYGKSIKQTADGGFIICGTTYLNDSNNSDLYLVKVDGFGDTLWTRAYGGAYSDFGNDVLVTYDNCFIAVGTTHSYNPDEVNIYAIKVNNDGDMVWTSTFGDGLFDIGNSICELDNGNFLINGTTQSYTAEYPDGYLIEVDNNGDTVWTQAYGGDYADEGTDLAMSYTGSVYLLGSTESFGFGGPDMYLIKLPPLWTGIFEDQTTSLKPRISTKCSPNPFNSTVSIQYNLIEQSNVEIEIYDLLGRIVETVDPVIKEAGDHQITWSANGQPSGVYFYRIEAGNYTETKKMMLLK